MEYKVEMKQSDVFVQLNMRLPAIIGQKEKWFVAACPILDVVSQGETEEKAKSNLVDALSLFLTSCLEHGTLDAVLKSCGFHTTNKNQTGYKTPVFNNYIDVPVPFYVDMDAPNRCHV